MSHLKKLLVFAVGAGACGSADVLDVPARRDYACRNAPMAPDGPFRVIYLPDGTTRDTTPVYANRYLEPHRSLDTVRVIGRDGNPILFIWGSGGDTSTYCVTLFDSLVDHLPNARGYMLVP